MKTYGNTLRHMEIYRNTLKYTEIYGNICRMAEGNSARKVCVSSSKGDSLQQLLTTSLMMAAARLLIDARQSIRAPTPTL